MATDSPAGTERGGHAHRVCHQILIATAGTVVVEYDDEDGTGSLALADATAGLHISPLPWARQTDATEGASLVLLASHDYDADGYINDRGTAKSLLEAST